MTTGVVVAAVITSTGSQGTGTGSADGTAGAEDPTARQRSWEAAWATGDLSLLHSWFRDNTGPSWASPEEPVRGNFVVEDQESADQLRGRIVEGTVTIAASDVSLRDLEILGTGARYLLALEGDLTGVSLSHIRIDGRGHRNSIGLGGASWSSVNASNLDITGVGFDAVRMMDSSTYAYMYIHDLWQWDDAREGRPFDIRRSQDTDPHTDGMQAVRGSGVIERSWIDISGPGANTTAAIFLKGDAGSVGLWSVSTTYINGGGYAIQLHEGEGGLDDLDPALELVNNRFGRDVRQGLFSHPDIDSSLLSRSGNVWADDLSPVPSDEGPLRDGLLDDD